MENEKKIFAVPVTWTMFGTYFVEASSEEEARKIAYNAKCLPNGMYVDDSLSLCEADLLTFANEQELVESGAMEDGDIILNRDELSKESSAGEDEDDLIDLCELIFATDTNK